MLYMAVICFVMTILSALFGFTGMAVGSAGIAKIFFVVFLVLFAYAMAFGGTNRRGPRI